MKRRHRSSALRWVFAYLLGMCVGALGITLFSAGSVGEEETVHILQEKKPEKRKLRPPQLRLPISIPEGVEVRQCLFDKGSFILVASGGRFRLNVRAKAEHVLVTTSTEVPEDESSPQSRVSATETIEETESSTGTTRP